MESRGGLADFNPGTGELTYYAAHQAPHNLRFNLSMLRAPVSPGTSTSPSYSAN